MNRLCLVVCCLFLANAPAAAQQPAAEKPAVDAFGDPLPDKAVARLGTMRFRHGHLISSVSFSADGKLLATAAHDGTVRVWDTATGQLHRVLGTEAKDGLPATFRFISSLAFAPDGKSIAASSNDLLLRSWDVGTGKQLFELRPGITAGLAYSPDSKTLAVGREAQVWLLEPDTGKQVRQWRAHNSLVNRLTFSPDGKSLATLGRDRMLRIWDASTGTEIRTIQNIQNTAMALALAYSPDGKMVASADHGAQARARVWDAVTGKELHNFEAPATGVSGLAFDPESKLLYAAALTDPKVRTWDLAQGKLVREMERPAGNVQSMALSPDGKVLALVGDQTTVLLYDPATGKRLNHTPGHEGSVTHLAFASDGKALATASADRTFRTWKRSGQEQRLLDPNGVVLAMTPDGQFGASGGSDGVVRLWNLTTGEEVKQLKGHEGQTTVGAFSPDGKWLVTGGSPEQTLRLWDVSSGQELRRFINHGGAVQRVMLSPDARVMVSFGGDGLLRFWDVTTGQTLRQSAEPAGHAVAMNFSPDGKFLATGSTEGVVRIWETATGKKAAQFTGFTGYVMAVAFAPDGRTLAAGNWGAVRLRDLATGKERGVFTGHLGDVTSLAFTPDGRSLASGGSDTTALLWDVRALPALETVESTAQELDGLFKDLSADDAALAFQAVMKMSGSPRQTLAYISGKVRPAGEVDPKTVGKMIDDLGADGLEVRRTAAVELERLGLAVAPVLRKALESGPEVDVELRLRVILSKLEGPSPTGERLRPSRTVQVLEMIGDDGAKTLLEKLTGGAAAAELTQEAKAAVARLSRWPAER